MKRFLFIISSIIFSHLQAQNTLGLTDYQVANLDGYILFSPMTATNTYLIDKCGEKVHEWNTSTYRPGLSTYLLEDGSIIRTGILNNPNFNEGGSGGIIERFDWNGNRTWSYVISDSNFCQHHDIKVLPNGNILAIVWDRYSQAEAIAAGKNTSYGNTYLWSEKIIELEPIGVDSANIVWEWKLWDHLVQDFDGTKPNFGVVADYPELVNINYFPGQPTNIDWIHLNSIDYNPTLDQVLVSSHTLNEIWIIDHSTTTVEAAGHSGGNSGKGGDLLYRWGNPQAYQRGNPSTKVFFGQHHATWIPDGYPNAGKIIIFNNGLNRPGTYSSIDIIDPPLNATNQYTISPGTAFLPNTLFWTYTAPNPADFYSSNISGVYPLENGSFLITSGANGTFFEIDSNKQSLWEYINPVTQGGILAQGAMPVNNVVFRADYYSGSYPGLFGRVLMSQGAIELNPSNPSLCELVLSRTELETQLQQIQIYPNPCTAILNIDFDEDIDYIAELRDPLGRRLLQEKNSKGLDLTSFAKGIYWLSISTKDGRHQAFKIIR